MEVAHNFSFSFFKAMQNHIDFRMKEKLFFSLICVHSFVSVSQGEIDAHEDSFRATDEAGQALLNTGHYASEEVKEKVGI